MKRYRISRKVLMALFLAGLAASFYLLYLRVSAEIGNRVFSASLDMEELKTVSLIEGVPLRKVINDFRKSGANAVSVYAFTLETLEREGKAIIFPGYEGVNYAWLKGEFNPSFTYAVFKDGKLAKEVASALCSALGRKRVSLKLYGNHILIEVKKDLETLLEIPLGFSREEIDLLKGAGFKIFLRIKNFREVNRAYIRYIFDQMDKLGSEKIVIFEGEEVLGYPLFIDDVAEEMKKRGYLMGVVEFAKQSGKESLALKVFPRLLLVHSIDPNEMLTYTEGKAVSRYLRAVKERSMRVLYLRFFLNRPGDLIRENIRYVSTVIADVKGIGFKLGVPKPLPFWWIPIPVLLVILLGVASLTVILIDLWRPLSDHYKLVFLALITLIYVNFYLERTLIFGNICLAFMVSIVFPVWGMSLLLKRMKKVSLEHRVGSYVKGFTELSFYPLLASLSAAVYIGGVLGEPLFMTKLLQFKGVKLAYLLPLLISGLLAFYSEGRKLRDFLKEPLLKEEFLVFLVLIAVLGVYLLRSGNFPLLRPALVEREARSFLESLLYARPRFKEFLIGYPAIALFIFLSYRGFLWRYRPLVFMFGAMAPVSVINTFCHIHTPVLFSLLRTLNGFILGWFLSVVVLFFLYFIPRAWEILRGE
ncbi:MAG: hypothetical protein J7M13_06440 [Synergistetes bacterium]|nr:hypothetical protein [Synergistota bacterium]